MGKIRKFAERRIKDLEEKKDEFSLHADILLMLSSKFKNSLLYIRLKTGASLCELEIELWKSLIGGKNETNEI